MKKFLYICLASIIALISCKSSRINSLAVVGQNYISVRDIFTDGDSISPNPDIKMFGNEDSLIVLSHMNNNPFEAIFLFENDTCHFQRLKIYCSPCADRVVDDIVGDKNYNFEILDPVNYIARAKKDVIMRLKESVDEAGDCNEITIHRISRK